jgi:hypothetical protein
MQQQQQPAWRPYQYEGQDTPNDTLTITKVKAQWDHAPLRTPVPEWLVERFPQHRAVREMQQSFMIEKMLYDALIVDKNVPTADLVHAAAWITVRMKMLSPNKQKALIEQVCRSQRLFPSAQAWRFDEQSDWQVAFLDDKQQMIRLPLADFVADYLEPIYRKEPPSFFQREQKQNDREVLYAQQKKQQEKEREDARSHQARIDAAHAQVGRRLEAMRKESEREAARLYDEMVRKRIAQQDAEAVSEVYDKLVNVYGPKDQKAKLSKRLTYDDPDIVE